MTSQPQPALSNAEERFERARQQLGFVLAPLVFAGLWLAPLGGLSDDAHHLLAILGLTATLWITEAVPLPVGALVGTTLCVALGVAPAREVFKSFADPIIFLFLGSFLLAEAMLHHGLNRRIAFHILALPGVGSSPGRLLLAFGVITGFISMWVSNTATTALMFPIGVAILSEMARRRSAEVQKEIKFTELKFGTALMLLTAFAASVGGLGTPVGTPPNLIGIGLIEKHLNVKISFFQWLAFGAPLAAALVGFLVFYLHRVCPAEPGLMENNTPWLRTEKARLGPWRRGEVNALVAFGCTVILWLLPGCLALARGGDDPMVQWLSRRLPESMVALMGGLLLFVLPVDFGKRQFTLSWNEARRIDWGIILLFGGGLALGELMFTTGLASWMGEGLAGAFQTRTVLGLTVLFSAMAIVLSEATSNTASATMIVPVAIAVAQAAGVNPLQPALAACLGASMGFMLPVSTAPNAIVYGSGCIPLMKMVRYGLALDLAGFILIVVLVAWLVPLVFT